MKKLVKLIALCCVLCISASMFACGKKDDSGSDTSPGAKLSEGIVDIIFSLTGEPDDYEFVQEEINNSLHDDGKPYSVKFHFIDESNYTTQLALKAGEGYDLAFIHYKYFSSCMQSGVLKDATPYLNAFGSELLNNTPSYAWKAVESGGKYYAIPRNMPVSDNDRVVAARKDWLESFGMTDIKTEQDLDKYFAGVYSMYEKEVREGIREKNSSYVYCADNHYTFLLREYCPSFYFPIMDYAFMPVYIDLDPEAKEDGKYVVKNYFESDEFLDLITKTRSYYNQGYISENDISGSENYFNYGLLGMCWSTLFKTTERIENFKSATKNASPDAFIYDIYLNPDDDRYIVQGYENAMALLDGSKMPNEAVDFLNWIRSSQKNYDLVCYGIENRNYKLTADGKLDFTGIPNGLRYADKMPYWAFNDIRYQRYSKLLSDEYIDHLKNWDTADNIVVSPLAGFSPDFSSVTISSALANVQAASSAMTQLVDGRVDPREVVGGKTRIQAIRDTVKTAGIDTLIAELQKQVDKFLGQ